MTSRLEIKDQRSLIIVFLQGAIKKREVVEEAKEKRATQYGRLIIKATVSRYRILPPLTDPMYDYYNCVQTMQYQGRGYSMATIEAVRVT